jgi:hypothetical protein
MKKAILVLAVLCIFGFVGGCGDVKDALDIEFSITRDHIFTIRGSNATLSYDINLDDNDDYRKYKDKIRSIEIEYIRYSITSNTGSGGTGDFYAGPYGSAFSTAIKVAKTISFAAGETPGETDVEWINKAYLESLLTGGKLSLWAVATGSGVDIIVPVVIKVEITANPLE